MLQYDNPFWRFSLAVYAAPGVADECLALQDTRGVDVNVLLFCAWLGSRRVTLTEAELAAIDSTVRSWRNQVVQPLRGVRRDIKTRADAAQEDIAALRKEVATLELRAEQLEHAMLYGTAATLNDPSATVTPQIAIRHNISHFLARQDAEPARLIEAAIAHANAPDRGETKACA